MANRLLPLALVVAAALADARASHELAFYLLVAAVPAAAIAALSSFGELVELPGRASGELVVRLQVLLGSLGLLGVVVAAAVRGQATEASAVPAAGISALVASLVLYAAYGAAALVAPAPARKRET